MGRARGRGLDPERALEISITGTANRLAADNTPTVDAIGQLRDLAGDRTDVLARACGGAIGGYLGHPMTNPLELKAAYLLALAGAEQHHDLILSATDTARRNISGSAYSL